MADLAATVAPVARLMIAGTGSGSGKTTVTMAVLAALRQLGLTAVSFKCGPDYIDPMFHKKATGIESRNLDIFLMGEGGIACSLLQNSRGSDVTVLEGVMGLYDGESDTSYASSNHVALATQTPVVLVVNARGAARSIAATIQGFRDFEENNIQAVLLNNIKASSFGYYQQMIERETGLKALGYLPSLPEVHLESRHLGLVTADEVADIQAKIAILGRQALEGIDFNALLAVARNAPPLQPQATANQPTTVAADGVRPRIYVAQDPAFCFWYEDNHDLLRGLGAELCPFSPLADQGLPEDADGLVLWGGYPELYAAGLQANQSMRQSLKAAIERGLPTYAECGGFMYLQEGLTDLAGQHYEMLGVLPGSTMMTHQLQDFGYFTIEAQRDNMLCSTGDSINAHFFHHSTGDMEGTAFTATKASGKSISCIVAEGNVFAGYQHLHFYGNTEFARRFVQAADDYRRAHHATDN